MVLRAGHYLAEYHAEALDMREVASRLGVSYSSFPRSFVRETGLSPWQYVMRLRIERARRLLSSGDAKLEDIALRIGFSSAFHLSTAFRQAEGIAPSVWRKKAASRGDQRESR